jgi:hypothetical protein
MTPKREVFSKRYLGLGFYLKREGESHWLGHETEGREGGIRRVRITKAAYDELMKVRRLLERKVAT